MKKESIKTKNNKDATFLVLIRLLILFIIVFLLFTV